MMVVMVQFNQMATTAVGTVIILTVSLHLLLLIYVLVLISVNWWRWRHHSRCHAGGVGFSQ